MSSLSIPLARGIFSGSKFAYLKQIDDGLIAESEALQKASTQFGEAKIALSMVEQALAAAGVSAVPFPGSLSNCIAIAPAILALFIEMKMGSPTSYYSAILIQKFIGPLYELIALVSSVALITFGSPAFGIASLSVISLGLIARVDILPTTISHAIRTSTPYLSSAAGLFLGDPSIKFITLISVASFCYQKYRDKAEVAIKQEEEAFNLHYQKTLNAGPTKVDLPLLEKILQQEVTVEISPYHLYLDTLLPSLIWVKIDELRTQFDRIDWTVCRPAIFYKFQDEITELLKENGEIVDSFLIYLKKFKDCFLSFLKLAESNSSESRLDRRQQVYLKMIALQLSKEDQPSLLAEDFIDLVDFRQKINIYSESFSDKLEALFLKMVWRSKEITLANKILLTLETDRTSWFFHVAARELYGNELEIVLNRFDRKLGMRSITSGNNLPNIFASQNSLSHTSLPQSVKNILDLFQNIYTTPYVFEKFIEAAQKASTENLLSWYTNWVTRQEISTERKEELLSEIRSNQLLGFPIAENGLFNRELLKIMALEMGVLKVTKGPANYTDSGFKTDF